MMPFIVMGVVLLLGIIDRCNSSHYVVRSWDDEYYSDRRIY